MAIYKTLASFATMPTILVVLEHDQIYEFRKMQPFFTVSITCFDNWADSNNHDQFKFFESNHTEPSTSRLQLNDNRIILHIVDDLHFASQRNRSFNLVHLWLQERLKGRSKGKILSQRNHMHLKQTKVSPNPISIRNHYILPCLPLSLLYACLHQKRE